MENKLICRSMNERTKMIIQDLCVVMIITSMAAAAELTGETEIIFPEIAAIATGCFLAPGIVWKTSYVRMSICVTLCAIAGAAIVYFIPAPLWQQLLLAYVCGQLILLSSGTTFAPMISAIALPVLMQTRSMIYPVSALLLTLISVILRKILENTGIKSRNTYEPQPLMSGWDKTAAADVLVRSAAVGIGAWLCISIAGSAGTMMKFCVAPPLLVAFTELTKPECPAGKKRIRTLILVTLCAFAGAVCRSLVVMKAGFSAAAASAIIAFIMIAAMRVLRIYFPPAGAMGVLALLVPGSAAASYPLQVFIGITAITAVSGMIVHIKEKYMIVICSDSK